MVVFGILLHKNLKSGHIRIQPINNTQKKILRKRDIDLMKIASPEVFSTVLLTFSYPINLLYGGLTYNMITKSENPMQIE
jgi:hypothetical protein